MAYLNENAQLGGLFDFLAVSAATKAIAQGKVPVLSTLLKTAGIRPLQSSQSDLPLSMTPKVLPPMSKPLPPAAPAPKAGVKPDANQVQEILTAVSSAFTSLRKGEQPLATAIGTRLAPERAAPSSTAMKVSGAPSGTVPTSPPVNTQTYEAVNQNGGALVPMAYQAPPMPAWVVPAALIGGGVVLFMVLRNR